MLYSYSCASDVICEWLSIIARSELDPCAARADLKLVSNQILRNAVTSQETLLNGYSIKTMLYKSPSLIIYCIRLYTVR